MSLVLNTNIASMNAQRNLANTQSQQATTFERLSTGLRVNSAKDDAAGLYLAQSQTKDIRGLDMATRNANDGISMAQTAEGALDQIGQNLQRINELAIQSANGTYSDAAREGLQKEVDELTQEVNRIYETTEFNGQPLLNDDALATVLQIGFNNDNNARIETGLAGGLREVDGMDSVTFFGSKDSFNVTQAEREQGFTQNDNVREAFLKQIGFNATAPDVAAGDAEATDKFAKALANQLKVFQGDHEDLESAIAAAPPGSEFKFSANGIDFTLEVEDDTPPTLDGSTITGYYGATGQNADGEPTGGTRIELETGTDGLDGTVDFRAANAYEDGVVNAGILESYSAYNAADADYDQPDAVFIENGNALFNILEGDLGSVRTVDISTQGAAQSSISATRAAIDQVSEIRATFGAVMNRFEAVISGNQIYSENLSAARSRIQDADFATETSNLAKQQVLQQAGISSLSQANASSQAILGLLG